ncbi:MAG: glycosyltransferase [Thermoguttaceae bacterium]|jgi:glycosyltransferase involved in cell wall biosynthesis
MRCKILFIIPTLDRCGAEKQLTLLATNLPKDRFDVRVLLLTRGGPYLQTLLDSGIPVELVGKKGKLSLLAYFRVKRAIKRFKPDVVHTWLFAANAYGRKAAFACKVPVVICGERCVDPWKGALHRWIDKKLEPKTDAYAVNSSGIVDFYSRNGIPSEKFVVIPNAVEPPTIETPLTKRRLLEELGLPAHVPAGVSEGKQAYFEELEIAGVSEQTDEPYIIGLVARLWPQKRIKDALWAADQLKFSLLNFYLIVIGDGPERDALLRYRDDLQLRDRVVFLGERNDVERFMPCFDLLWNCSAYEGQSNSILEAQSFGVPVMASDIPGNRDLVIPGVTGLLMSEFDGDDTRRRTGFSRETIRLLRSENKEILKNWGEAGKKRVAKEFSLTRMIERYVELYERLLASKQKAQ